ncbi:double-strand break repair helicase AddA [Bauldia sp.]|uniref:double-strand break repair helicase AddA n=1 Tax=Bauldia sp. TaxID=2575872 RepID=UPI003BA94277
MAPAAQAIAVDKATAKAQGDASNPHASAWVSANAGSGKTYVLAQRVIRLLLAGNDPGRILCLTFTRAAAAEMAKRVFDRLSAWTTLPDTKLAREIRAIEGGRPDAAKLAEARRLFARALETPGGLKIQTIHAFCERLLHQFPFEANVAGHFEVLDERDAAALVDEARRRMLAEAARAPDGPLGSALATALAAASEFIVDLAIRAFIADRQRLRAWTNRAGSLDRALIELRDALAVAEADASADLREAILGECALAEALEGLVEKLAASGSSRDRDAAERLSPIVGATTEDVRIDAYLAFWKKRTDGQVRSAGSLVTKAVKNDSPGLEDWLEEERERLVDLLDRLSATECYETTAAILSLADAAIREYDKAKVARGVLDFDDLIAKTATLLEDAKASQWVHYKLDRGLDHILVDEAQDTSPTQWHVIAALAEEFFAGEGAREVSRTLFAVGDEKQSIFSFQGAVPAWFARMRDDLGGRARSAGLAWTDPALHLSFRSTGTVLAAVDTVFASETAYRGLSSDMEPPQHDAARVNVPGQVIVWPMIEPPEKPEPADWTSPVDHLGDDSPEVQLADRIAETITGWLHREEPLVEGGAPIRPGGILILTRTRGAQTDAINRALKTRRIPIAGADRLMLTEHIAVMDLMALGRVMLLPEDDLSLAAVLKSPLIGLDEDQLFAIAHGRGRRSLWQALREAARSEGGVFADARDRLETWRSRADTRDPYTFYAEILADKTHGRRQFLRRLGSEAEDVLDEYLAQALAYEKTHTPSLEGFLAWLDASETQIRRDTDTIRDEVRVMTVHGAKGLEADIVFLVDTGAMPVHPNHDPRVIALDDDKAENGGPLVWMRNFKAMPEAIQARVKALREDADDEYRRLLYVAMTRARDRLYVCGTMKPRATDQRKGWHALVTAALEPECTRHEDAAGRVTLEWRAPAARSIPTKGRQEAMTFAPQRPAWIETSPAPPPSSVRRITPSAIASPATAGKKRGRPAEEPTMDAAERGRLIHRLLESLPEFAPENRKAAGEKYLATAAESWSDSDREALVAETLAVLDDPTFAPVFAPGSRPEVEIAGTIGDARLSGRIDRMVVDDERVLIVDYKTNQPAPETLAEAPHDYVIQLGLYAAILKGLYPTRRIDAAILWTDRPALMAIPSEMLVNAAKAVVARSREKA